jgi:hypothetical protein
MAGKGLVRSDYWNRITGSVRAGDTRRDETVTDVEGFLMPYGQAATAGLHLWGIADGLAVSARANQPGLTVTAGAALDAAGRVIVVAGGGMAVTDPDIDPADLANIPTVAVDTTGVSVSTANRSGTRYLTVRYLEASVEGLLGNAPALVHAPWLRLREGAEFTDDGTEVVLAQVTLENGNVSAVSAELRRLVGLPAARLQLRRPTTATDSGLTVGHTPAGELRARPDGGIVLDVAGPSGAPTSALSVDPAGRIGIGVERARRHLHVEGSEIHCGGPEGGFSFADRSSESFVEDPDEGQRWRWYAKDGTARLWSGTDRLSVAPTGNIGIGISAQQARRPLHVEGHEIHSGGSAGGFSFADRNVGSFVEGPNAGQRWVWYAQNGIARLWSGGDQLSIQLNPPGVGPGLDVHRRMRVRQGGDHSAGIWFFQDGQGDRGFVGMADNTQIGFWGNTGAGWGITMDTSSGRLSANRGINAAGGGGLFSAGVLATGGIGVQAEAPLAVFAKTTTGSWAGYFDGDVRVIGTLTKTRLQFEIDHPLDPANKFLRHSAIESDEMKNIYDGVAQLDSQGHAEVVLPDWFEALNENFRYQLTPIGAPAPDLHIAGELRDGRFSIAGGQPGSTVCWQVSGVRHDAYAKAHPLQVESEKSRDEAGLYLHPHEQDAPIERSLATLVTAPVTD